MTTRIPALVPDAGPIIHLDELGRLDLLNDFEEIRVAPTVWEEVAHHRPCCLEFFGARAKVVLPEPAMVESVAPLCRALSLDAGEREALAIARNDPRVLFVTDDAAARIAAVQMGIETHGTIGLVVRAARRGQMTPAGVLAVIEGIPRNSSLHIKSSLLREVVAKLRTEYGR